MSAFSTLNADISTPGVIEIEKTSIAVGASENENPVNPSNLNEVVQFGGDAAPTIKVSETEMSPAKVLLANVTSPAPPHVKKHRPKIYTNGYFMTFDKTSVNGKKNFWRCEYKNVCKARIHTNSRNTEVYNHVSHHNHGFPSKAEVMLYGIDPVTVVQNRVYTLESPADPILRRRIRKLVIEQNEADRKKEEEEMAAAFLSAQSLQAALLELSGISKMSLAPAVPAIDFSALNVNTLLGTFPSVTPATNLMFPTIGTSSDSVEASMSSLLKTCLECITPMTTPSPQISPILASNFNVLNVAPTVALPVMPITAPTAIPPLLPPNNALLPLFGQQGLLNFPAKKEEEPTNDSLFLAAFQVASQLRTIWNSEPSLYPRTNPATTTHFDFFLAKDDGTDDHLFLPFHIEQRDEQNLKQVLQQFANQQCNGNIVLSVTPKMSVAIGHEMIAVWDNNQHFLLDASDANTWRLKFVDDRIVKKQ